jgi:hypothetical protein
MFMGLNNPSAMGFMFCKISEFSTCRKLLEPLVEIPNSCPNYYGANSVKILIISDIHGNYHALDCVMKNVRFDVLICCGDIAVDYPFPERWYALSDQ